jgi:hypothetical protein
MTPCNDPGYDLPPLLKGGMSHDHMLSRRPWHLKTWSKCDRWSAKEVFTSSASQPLLRWDMYPSSTPPAWHVDEWGLASLWLGNDHTHARHEDALPRASEVGGRCLFACSSSWVDPILSTLCLARFCGVPFDYKRETSQSGKGTLLHTTLWITICTLKIEL